MFLDADRPAAGLRMLRRDAQKISSANTTVENTLNKQREHRDRTSRTSRTSSGTNRARDAGGDAGPMRPRLPFEGTPEPARALSEFARCAAPEDELRSAGRLLKGCGRSDVTTRIPCGLKRIPCGLKRIPCGLKRIPCGLKRIPCGLSASLRFKTHHVRFKTRHVRQTSDRLRRLPRHDIPAHPQTIHQRPRHIRPGMPPGAGTDQRHHH